MLLEALGTARDLGRLHEITSVLIRFGFGDVVRRLGLGKALESTGRMLHWKEAEELARLEPPQRIRRALEDMGPSFVKLGQILATRADLLPPEYIAEFAKLQDHAPPVAFETLEAQLTEELGAPLAEVFAEVDRYPLAAASVAQVHRGVLKTGEQVILKIRRPGIRKIVDADLRLLKRLAEIAEEEIEESRHFRPKEIAAEFARSMRRELDLAAECRTAERIADSFRDDENIVVPKVYWQWTSESLNVQEYIDGIPGRDMAAVDVAGLDRKLLAQRGANAVLKMVFEDGFFHADPHQGNVFYLPGNKIVFIDFGMAGQLSDRRRNQLVDLLFGIVERKVERVVEILLGWSKPSQIDEDALNIEIDAFIDRIHGVPLKSLDLTALIADLTTLLREYRLMLPADLTLLTKAFVSLEGMGRQLDPDYDLITAIGPFLNRVVLQRYTPQALARRGREGLSDALELMGSLPYDLRKLIKLAQKGDLQLKLDVQGLDQFASRLDRIAGRLTIGIVIAALIMGSSIVMTAAGGQIPIGLSFFTMVGFFIAVLGGLWIIISIWRGR
ncbi:ABC1 kinase family protein [Roseibium aggregatum]|jgi:ubiquinone biosynthesis protein|uniref:ABC1 kinase family protein n=1 Tax=Roseibium aggregatum TaxID=187304 RepID=UPI001E3FC66D|nr:AarF/UbiB family protein [Roseibium aggregatum]UES41874.1 ubiquinone biosynthesis protein UbiB [Roseibium aggregatum]UES42057.1 ubiquinone biosynthesis protein UbiB [Roseibium aggregatum]